MHFFILSLQTRIPALFHDLHARDRLSPSPSSILHFPLRIAIAVATTTTVAMPSQQHHHSGQRTSRHRSTLSLQKTEIKIHVYDLLPVSPPTTPTLGFSPQLFVVQQLCSDKPSSAPIANACSTSIARKSRLCVVDNRGISASLGSGHQRSRIRVWRPR